MPSRRGDFWLNMENPLISVIVPVYKVEKYLHNCINSILNQSYSNWELILVNDGSPDRCPQICDEFATQDKRIRVIHKENGGVSSARNAALDICKGEYISFLDSDDFWHHNYLSNLLTLALVHSADIVQCGLIRGTGLTFPPLADKNIVEILDNHSVFIKGYAKIIVCAKLYRRSVLEGLRMPQGKFFEDDFTTWKWYYNSKKIVATSEKLYYYTDNQQSTMANHSATPRLDFIEAYDERIAFFQKEGHKDLEDCSRAHLCKSMLLNSMNVHLSDVQKKTVTDTFMQNWKIIRFSPFLPFTLRALFAVHVFAPGISKTIVKKLYKA